MPILPIISKQFLCKLSPIKQIQNISTPETTPHDTPISSRKRKVATPSGDSSHSFNSTPVRNQASTFPRKCRYDISPCTQLKLPENSDSPAKPAAETAAFKVKDWRNRSKEEALRDRYLSRDYLYHLVHETYLYEFDSGRKPICHSKCCLKCQDKFVGRVEDLEREMTKWWGTSVSNDKRTVMLGEELMKFVDWNEDGSRKQRYRILGEEVCRNFYLRARGMHHSTCDKIETDIFCKDRSLLSLGSDLRTINLTKSEKRNELEAWLDEYADDVGCKMPHEDIRVLPHRNIKPIQEEYNEDLTAEAQPQASQSYFYKVFTKCADSLKIRLARDTGTLARCTVCNAYDQRLRAARTPMERAQIKRFRAAHHNKQELQRKKYYHHRRKAKKNPSRYLSVIIDGMDQKKTNCPSLGKYTKDEPPLAQRVIGVKVHGKKTYAFICDETVRKGGNLICEILRVVLNDLDSNNELPFDSPVLYLQVDNCGENKNKSLIAFLSDLVRRKVFAKVKAGFLMVGHTHDDIDHIFSIIATHLKQHHIRCPDQESLFAAIKRAFHDEEDIPDIRELFATDVFDYDTLYKQVLDPDLCGYQEPHQFRIKNFHTCTNRETSLLHYKNWAHTKEWLPPSVVPERSPTLLENAKSPTDENCKPRKMSRGILTKAQRINKAVSHATQTVHTSHPVEDVPENNPYHSDHEAEVFQNGRQVPVCQGIQWISNSPSLQNAPLVQFDEHDCQQNIKKTEKIMSDILTKFAPKYQNIFDPTVMEHWNVWKQRELNRWTSVSAEIGTLRAALMLLPSPYTSRERDQDANMQILIEDSAPADLPEHIESICHNSGQHGTYSKRQKLDNLRVVIAEEECLTSTTATVFSETACIFKYDYPKLIMGQPQFVQQIGVGVIKAVHGDPSSPGATFDIQFCPPKGSKPQSSKRPDTLYQDIDADMSFKMNHTIKKGKMRMPDISKHLPKDVLLAFNLQINKSKHCFSKVRLADSKYNMSSYAFANNVISSYYQSRPTQNA